MTKPIPTKRPFFSDRLMIVAFLIAAAAGCGALAAIAVALAGRS